jgi:hypothetical protein
VTVETTVLFEVADDEAEPTEGKAPSARPAGWARARFLPDQPVFYGRLRGTTGNRAEAGQTSSVHLRQDG